jgi:uncharacterized protein (DUF58 family)
MAIHYLLLTLFALYVLQTMLFRRFGMRSVEYERNLSVGACFQGDEISLVERLENRKWLPVPWLRVESQLPIGLLFHSQANMDISSGSIYQNHKSFFSLMPYTKITRRHALTCMRRGVFRLESVTLSNGDLFGVTTFSSKLSFDLELVVYPKPLAYEDMNLPSHSWQGDVTVRRWIVEDPFLTAGTREYRYGDSMRSVNWNATARSGKLQVNRHDYTADHRLFVILNVEDHEGMWDAVNDVELVEYGISMAAGLAQHAVTQGMEVGFAANAGTINDRTRPIRTEIGGGLPHLTDLYETMARLVVERLLPMHELLYLLEEQLEERTDIVLLSAYESGKLAEAIASLRMKGHSVSCIRIEKEAAAPSREELPA